MTAGRTRIHLCGRLVVELAGRRVEDALPGRQGRLLVAYLVLHRHRPVRRDELVEALWGGEGRPPSAAALGPPLSRLRKVLGPDRLEGRAELRLVLEDDAWVDWEAAPAALRDARAALDAGDAERAADAARDAVGVADGGLLPGLEAAWIDAARGALDELRLDALEALATAGLRLGGRDLVEAQRAAQAAVDAAPFRESARIVLIEALRARGNVAEALRAYEDVRVLLREELGGTPGPALVALHEDLLGSESPARPAPAPATRLSPGADPLVEREAELAALEPPLTGALAGTGAIAIVHGAAGIGKTSLLRAVRDRARAAGAHVATARAGQLERELAFGVVRQLLEPSLADPARRAQLLTGGAAPAAAVFDPAAGSGDDTSFATLHGLLWVVIGLAAERPLALAVDDLQWADRPSLRFLAYLAPRLDELPVLLVATLRPVPDADVALIDEIARQPGARTVRPRALSERAVGELAADRLGAAADPAFAAVCRRTTGGNPLLVGELLEALAADGVRPDAASAALVEEIGPRAVSRTVLARLSRLRPEARVVAEAVALLGDGADLATVAAVAGLSETDAAETTAALAGAEILRAESPLGFAHPLVRDAVYRDLPPGERELRHAATARALLDRGAADERIATQLLHAPRRGEAWAVEVLERAAAAALRRGGPEGAVAYLARALEEPPAPEIRPRVLLALGTAEEMTHGPSAHEHLRGAYATLADPSERARAAHLLGRALLFTGDPAGASAFAREGAAALPADLVEPRRVLEGLAQAAMWIGMGVFDDLEATIPFRTRPVRGGAGTHALASIAAMGWAFSGGPADECAELALAALDGGLLRASDRIASGIVLALADREEALAVWEDGFADAYRHGSLFEVASMSLWAGFTMLQRGDLVEAQEALERCLADHARWGSAGSIVDSGEAFLALARLGRGDVDGARAALGHRAAPAGGEDSARAWRTARLELLAAEGRIEEALSAADELRRAPARTENPTAARWRCAAAGVLAAAGRRSEAIALAEEDLALARPWGAPTAVGRALRTLGTLEGDDGRPRLREAAAMLAGSPAKLEHARALAALGAALARTGSPEAAEPLGRALELAGRCGAHGLAQSVERELVAAGVDVTPALAGPPSLSDAERRILSLAADGLTSRQIAEALYITPGDAERRLARAAAKLG